MGIHQNIDFFDSILAFFDQVNTYIQFILSVLTIFTTLFVFMLPYFKPLYRVLRPIGIKNTEILRIVILSLKKPRVFIRLYIELVLIKSEGLYQRPKWWRQQRVSFKKLIDDRNSTFIINVENPFNLVKAEFSIYIERYFEYFRNQKAQRKFAITNDEVLSFVSDINIQEGYCSPITFIMGLNDRYNEDWEKILNNYFTAFISDTDIQFASLPEELYLTYNWLMWGPSYQNQYKDDKYKLIQYGFGDESTSINLVLGNTSKSNDLWNILNNESENDSIFGVNCSISGKINDTREFYFKNYENLDVAAIPFVKRLSCNKTNVPFLLELNNFEVLKSHKADNYFFSAYLWIMFSLVDPNTPNFSPRKSVTFFEHANLADSNNYIFLLESLINKCFQHFISIAEHEQKSSRKYVYSLCMNEDIENLFFKKYKELLESKHGAWFSEHLIINNPFSVSEILDAFDNYFDTSEDPPEILDINLKENNALADLCYYYASFYLPNDFTLSSIKLEKLISVLKNNESSKIKTHVVIAKIEKEVIGGLVISFLPEYNCGIINGLVVDEKYRNKDVGARLVNHSIQQIREEARTSLESNLEYVIAPVLFDPNNLDKTSRFWKNNEFYLTENNESIGVHYFVKCFNSQPPPSNHVLNTAFQTYFEIWK